MNNTKPINFSNIKLINKKNKKVVSTCIFVVQENYLSYKSSVYITGLLKSVETFQNVMGKDWIYRIYYDSMYDNYVTTSKTLDRQYHIDTDIYQHDKHDDRYNNVVKESTQKYKDYVKFMMDITSNCLQKLRKYDFVELISYDCPSLKRRQYIGHPYTFGSLARYYAMFDPDVDIVFFTNASNPISPYVAKKINKWVSGKKPLVTSIMHNYDLVFSTKRKNDNEFKFQKDIYLKLLKDLVPDTFNSQKAIQKQETISRVVRFPAGLFGIKTNEPTIKFGNRTIKISHLETILNNFIKNNNGNDPDSLLNIWGYGVDENILSLAMFPVIDSFQNNQYITDCMDLTHYGTFSTNFKEQDVVKFIKSTYKKHNNKTPPSYIENYKYEPRIQMLTGFNLLEKIYNKPIDNIKVKINNTTALLWGIQSSFNEKKPIIYLFDFEPKRFNAFKSLEENNLIDFRVIFPEQNSKYIKHNNTKNIIFDYSSSSSTEKTIHKINKLVDDISEYYRNLTTYIPFIYTPYDNDPLKLSDVTNSIQKKYTGKNDKRVTRKRSQFKRKSNRKSNKKYKQNRKKSKQKN